MIIVEGPDGAGKTTFVHKMQEALRYPVADRVVDKATNALTDLQEWVENNLYSGFQGVIFDRHRLISEVIYGPLIRPGQNPDFMNRHWLTRSLQELYRIRPVIIYCLPPRETVHANLTGDDDNAVPAPHIDAIYDLYVARSAMDLASAHKYSPFVDVYDYTTDARDEQAVGLFDVIGGYVHHYLDGA